MHRVKLFSKSFVWVIRMLCIFPLNDKFQNRFCSFAWFWSIFLGLSVIIAQGRPRGLGGLQYFSNLLFLLRSVYFFISPIIHSPNFKKLTDVFEEFDHQFFKTYGLVVRKRLWNKSSFWIAIIILNTVFILLFRILLDFYHPVNQSIYNFVYEILVYIYSYNFRQIYLHLYLFFCLNAISRFQDFHLEWTTIINIVIKQKNNFDYLEITRRNYFLICQIVDNLNEYFGYIISFFYLSTLIEGSVNLVGLPFSGMEMLISAILIYLTSIMTVKIKTEVSFVYIISILTVGN